MSSDGSFFFVFIGFCKSLTFKIFFLVVGAFVGAGGRFKSLQGVFSLLYINSTRSVNRREYLCAVRSTVLGVLTQSSPPNSQTFDQMIKLVHQLLSEKIS